MPNHPLAEVFGFPILNTSEKSEHYRGNTLCPFNNKVPSCTKNSVSDPLGVCSIFHNDQPVITCPHRFTEDWKIAADSAEFLFSNSVFKSRHWTSLREVRLNDKDGESAGNIDFVLVSFNEEGKIQDFGSIEVQAVYISGNITRPFKYYMKDRIKNKFFDWTNEKGFPRPDYLSSSRKRLVPQMLYKGGILHSWGKKQVIILQRPFFNTIPDLPLVQNPEEADVAWFVYDLFLDETTNQYLLKRTDAVYTKFHSALNEITVPEAGDISDFIETLQSKLNDKDNFTPPDAPTLEDLLNRES